MDKRIFSGKTKEEALEQALITLQETKENIYVFEKGEKKGGLFKGKQVEIEVVTKNDIINFIKSYLQKLIHDMGIGVNLEVKSRDKSTMITVVSDNNALLIGKNGRTMDALSTILHQVIFTKYGVNFNFVLDVGEYKEKQQQQLIRLAKSVAKEVSTTKIDAKLDPMNSYQRRIVHNALSENKHVYTESEGEEPNRYVAIKAKEEEK